MTTPEQDIERKAEIRAEGYHKAMTPLRSYENARDDVLRLFPNADKGELLDDIQRILSNFDGNHARAAEGVAFMIEWRLAQ
jgi:hypothetical protein